MLVSEVVAVVVLLRLRQVANGMERDLCRARRDLVLLTFDVKGREI